MKLKGKSWSITGSGRPGGYQCPVCASRDISVFWEATDLPVFCNVLCATPEEARQVPRGDIRLGFCKGCGLITNLAFEPQRLEYGVEYENSLHFSPRFRQYADGLASRLVDRYGLRGKIILEIACGKGDFLRKLCTLGDNQGIGFDPSYVPNENHSESANRVTFVRDLYSERYADYEADFICCRQALEHVADPVAFLRMVRRNIGDRSDTVLFFEVPNALFTLRELGIWDLIYEHCTYFVPSSLCRLFALSGFDVLHVTEEFGRQFLTIEARPGPAARRDSPGHKAGVQRVATDVREFATNHGCKLQSWRNRLIQMSRRQRRVVVWGAGSKGVTFLNILRADDVIKYVVDVNPRKQGKFVPGTGQRIIPPEFLREYHPDVTLVMNSIYRDEIGRIAAELGLRAELWTV